MNDYEYEIIESNGHLAYDNSLLEDDVLSFRPYYMEQKSSSRQLSSEHDAVDGRSADTFCRNGEVYRQKGIQY